MKKPFRLDRGVRGAASDVEREIALHLELRAREFQATGMSEEEARRAALAAFGDRASIADEVTSIHTSTVRERRRRYYMDELKQDLAVGLRGLRRAPAFTLVALLTLAIGIGANTAIFSVLESVLLRPLPYPNAEQLVQVWSDHRQKGRPEPEWLTPPDFADLRDGNRTFQGIAAYQNWAPDITGNGEPESLSGMLVSWNFLELLGGRPMIGRGFTLADDDANAERVVVLSEHFWRRRFGGDTAILGKPIILSGFEWKVIGVLPQSFKAPRPGAADLYRTVRRPATSGCGRSCVVLRGIGRLKPGATLAAAQADLGGIYARLAKEYPQTNEKVGAWLVPLHQQITGTSKSAILALSGAVAFVLLIGCVNLANLLLVRGAARAREMGVRAALGAGAGRITRQLITENALLAGVGGALGIGLGIVGSRLLARLVPDGITQVQQIGVDGFVLAFAVAITLVAGAIFGLLPALQGARASLMTSLRSSNRETGRHGNALRSGLVVTQLTLAVVLLVGSGLLMRSFLRMQQVDLGFRTSGVYIGAVFFPNARYPDAARSQAAILDFTTRLRTNPAVRVAEFTDLPVLTNGDQDVSVTPIGEPPRADLPPSIWTRSVSPGYISAMGMRLVAGRMLTEEDRQGAAQVALVNEEAAKRYFPGKDPVGRQLTTSSNDSGPRITIVGVVASVRHDGPNEPYKTEIFVPHTQFPSRAVTYILQPAGDVTSLNAAFRQALHDVDALIPMPTLEPIEQRIGEAVALPRLYTTLVSSFAAAALLLASLGVYGVMAYSVSQRQREIGVRLALGAAPTGISRMVLGQGGRLALTGIAVGLLIAVAIGRFIESLLFQVSVFDLPTFLLVPGVLILMTLLASWLPARRAMRVDPLVAIRNE